VNVRKAFLLGGDVVPDLLLRLPGSTSLPSGTFRDLVEENAKKSAIDFLFLKGLGLPFSSAMFSFLGDLSSSVSKNRDFLRLGDDDPSTDLRYNDNE
jgi:hypothetical protein